MSIDEKTDLEGSKSFPHGDGLQAVSGPADGTAPKYRDEENGPGAAHEVRINGIGEFYPKSKSPQRRLMKDSDLHPKPYRVKPMFSVHSRNDTCR